MAEPRKARPGRGGQGGIVPEGAAGRAGVPPVVRRASRFGRRGLISGLSGSPKVSAEVRLVSRFTRCRPACLSLCWGWGWGLAAWCGIWVSLLLGSDSSFVRAAKS